MLALDIAENGFVEVSPHATEEMANDHLQTTDCINLLRAGAFDEAEYIHGEWRYRSCSPRMCIVLTFISETRLRIITAWRNR